MPDPITLVIAGAAVGSATGKLVETSWDISKRWISSNIEDSQAAAIETAKDNAALFVVDLANRVASLETDNEGENSNNESLIEALSNPEVLVALNTSLTVSAQTANREKHSLLADLFIRKLLAEAESTYSLVTTSAIDTVKYLSIRHLDILGVLALICEIRPLWFQSDFGLDQKSRKMLSSWLKCEFECYTNLTDISFTDLWYLSSRNLISVHPGSTKADVSTSLYRSAHRTQKWDVDDYSYFERTSYSLVDLFNDSDLAGSLHQWWDNGLGDCKLTPPGVLIATNFHKSVSRQSFCVPWQAWVNE